MLALYTNSAFPRENVQVERCDRTLVIAFKAFVNTKHTNWDEKIVNAVVAINTAKQDATEATPFEIVYGRLAELPHERLFPWPATEVERHQDFLERVADFRTEIHERLKSKQQKVKARVDRKRKDPRQYAPGDLVLVARTIRKPKLTKKLLPSYIGPYQVVKRIGPLTYLVEELPASRKRRIWRRFPAHVSQLKPFRTPQDNLNWLTRLSSKSAQVVPKKTDIITRSGRRSITPDRFVPGSG